MKVSIRVLLVYVIIKSLRGQLFNHNLTNLWMNNTLEFVALAHSQTFAIY